MAHESAGSRGHAAERPRDIPWAGWRAIAFRLKDAVGDNNLSMIAAGVAFYGLLAIFPAIAAVVSIYGLIADPDSVQAQIAQLSGLLPEQARQIIDAQLTEVSAGPSGALGFGAGAGILLTVWSANKGTKALIEALNVAYGERERRGFVALNALSLALTLGGMVFVIAALALVAALPALLGSLGLSATLAAWARWLRWPVLALAFVVALAVLYRAGPSRTAARWRWLSWGAVAAAALWLAGSMLFSWYVANFGSYNETYGSLGAVVILLMWFWLSAFIVLLGAALNAEMEHETERDTTRGAPRPMGERGAYVADTAPERP